MVAQLFPQMPPPKDGLLLASRHHPECAPIRFPLPRTAPGEQPIYFEIAKQRKRNANGKLREHELRTVAAAPVAFDPVRGKPRPSGRGGCQDMDQPVVSAEYRCRQTVRLLRQAGSRQTGRAAERRGLPSPP